MLQLNSASKKHDHFDLPEFKKNILYESLASISRTSDYSSYLKGSLQSVSRCEYSLDDFGASSVTDKSYLFLNWFLKYQQLNGTSTKKQG